MFMILSTNYIRLIIKKRNTNMNINMNFTIDFDYLKKNIDMNRDMKYYLDIDVYQWFCYKLSTYEHTKCTCLYTMKLCRIQ